MKITKKTFFLFGFAPLFLMASFWERSNPCGLFTASAQQAPVPQTSQTSLVQPGHFEYLGAFRLPGGEDRPKTFAYGGAAMTFNPKGNPGSSGGLPGSLFITGHDRLPYEELPDGGQVAEISIPRPIKSKNPEKLPSARFLQDFHNVAKGYFDTMNEIPRMAMQYLDHQATGPKIHLAWGQHLAPEKTAATHAWFDPHLKSADLQGPWFIGDQSFYRVNGYLFEIPASWADQYAEGRYLATGRYRDGGWSGMGPVLFAYKPWINEKGAPAAPGTHLKEKVLLSYQSSQNTEKIEQCLKHYQHPDEWQGGAWLTTSTGKTAVLFAGTKAMGARYWYGYVNPAGPEYPCVDHDFVGQFPVCRKADGTPCPDQELKECKDHNDFRGWWSSRFEAQFLLYDPADLAAVAAGKMAPWKPQPYASVNIHEFLLLNPRAVETEMIGKGVQRRYLIGPAAYDRRNDLLYVIELFADQAKPVVHVWQVH